MGKALSNVHIIVVRLIVEMEIVRTATRLVVVVLLGNMTITIMNITITSKEIQLMRITPPLSPKPRWKTQNFTPVSILKIHGSLIHIPTIHIRSCAPALRNESIPLRWQSSQTKLCISRAKTLILPELHCIWSMKMDWSRTCFWPKIWSAVMTWIKSANSPFRFPIVDLQKLHWTLQ